MSTTLDGLPVPAESASARYWRALDGDIYEEMIRLREANGAVAYRQQEALLRQWLSTITRRLSRPAEVLEFGCGFGRHAQYLSVVPELRYYGYDFSEAMARPLLQNPPPSLVPVEERVLVGDPGVLDGRLFDAVFTVSVLIHNPPSQIGSLIERLCSLVRDTGEVCLVENQLVPFDVYENDWHDGCWLHAYATRIPPGWEMLVRQGAVNTHDIYLLRRSSVGGVFNLTPDFDRGAPLSDEDLWRLGRNKLERWARGASSILEGGTHSDDAAQSGAIEEMVKALELKGERRRRLDALAETAARARARSATPKVLQQYSREEEVSAGNVGLELSAPLDTRWAQADPRFARVLHLSHREWFGIRAATGFSPGRKVAVTSTRRLRLAEVKQIISAIEAGQINRVVFHGYTENFAIVSRVLRETFGKALGIAAVWHGSTAQFHFDEEHASFATLIELMNEGSIDWLGSVKPGLFDLSTAVFRKTLINFPPHLEESPAALRDPTGRVFIPMPNDWRKNFYTNLYAAAGSTLVREVIVSAEFKLREALPVAAKVTRIPRPSRRQVFQLMVESEIVLNASLSECQPMVALESATVHTPCITCRLGISELDRHPYQELAQVDAVDCIPAVRQAAENLVRLRRTDPIGLNQMMDDYLGTVLSAASASWKEFLRL